MVAYDAHPEAMPTAHLLPVIAQALGVPLDDRSGRSQPKRKLAKQKAR